MQSATKPLSEQPSIESLLGARGAWLKGDTGDQDEARSRRSLTVMIADNYKLFEEVRDRIFRATESFMRHVEIIPDTLSPTGHALVAEMLKHKVVVPEEHGHAICEVSGRRYLSGGWLEELAWLAAMDAGADEAFYGQVIGWSFKTFHGENEIDLIMRKAGSLGFVSCKALRSELDMHDRKQRNRLMDAVHEADNLADHFGREGECVAVLVTTDLHDEIKGAPRYNALMGKAAILDVRLLSLEDMGFVNIVSALREMWETPRES
jgi:Domain of unknown function (DUF1887)